MKQQACFPFGKQGMQYRNGKIDNITLVGVGFPALRIMNLKGLEDIQIPRPQGIAHIIQNQGPIPGYLQVNLIGVMIMLYLHITFFRLPDIFHQKFFIGLKGCVKHPFFLLENILECRFSVFFRLSAALPKHGGSRINFYIRII